MKDLFFIDIGGNFLLILLDCLDSLVVLSTTATLDLRFDSQVEQSVLRFFYEIRSSSSELGFVPGKLSSLYFY